MPDIHFQGGFSAKAFFLAGKLQLQFLFSPPIAKMIYSFRKIYYFMKHNKAHILLTVLILQLLQFLNNPLFHQIQNSKAYILHIVSYHNYYSVNNPSLHPGRFIFVSKNLFLVKMVVNECNIIIFLFIFIW